MKEFNVFVPLAKLKQSDSNYNARWIPYFIPNPFPSL